MLGERHAGCKAAKGLRSLQHSGADLEHLHLLARVEEHELVLPEGFRVLGFRVLGFGLWVLGLGLKSRLPCPEPMEGAAFGQRARVGIGTEGLPYPLIEEYSLKSKRVPSTQGVQGLGFRV